MAGQAATGVVVTVFFFSFSLYIYMSKVRYVRDYLSIRFHAGMI